MSNMIITGGYGESGGLGGKYAEIDWTKEKRVILFEIAGIFDVSFNVKSEQVNFSTNEINEVNFDINTNNITFKIDSFDVKFNTQMCIC